MTIFILHGPITDMRQMVDAAIEMAAHPEWTRVGMRYQDTFFSVVRNKKSITVRRAFGTDPHSTQDTEDNGKERSNDQR